MNSLPPGVVPERVSRLWVVDNGAYAFRRVTYKAGFWYIPELKKRGELGVDLFFVLTDAQRAAEANLERMAAEAGMSRVEMGRKLQAERKTGAGERRYRVDPPWWTEIGRRV